MNDEPGNFLARLKQHHLYGVVVAYAVVAAFLIQLVSRVFPYFGWAAAVPAVIVILLLGFPVVVVLAWLLIKPKDPAKSGTWQRRHWKLSAAVTVTVIVLVVISGFYGLRYSKRYAARLEAATATASELKPATTSASPAATVIPAKSIAVLPLENLSGDPNERYFSNGITEEILNALAQIPDLKVAGRTSAFQFNSKDQDLRKVGATLGVATLLVGSVQKAGDEVRINVQLVDTRSGYQMWSEKYDRKLTNIFAIEDDISSAIAGKLRVQLTGGAGQALVAQKTIDPHAHDFYLRGLTLLAARGPGLRDAVAAFQSAIKIAPDYADAWGAMAEAEALYPDYDLDTMQAAYPRALSAAQRALALDPNTASANVAQGMIYKNQWQWAKADAALRLALALAPGDVETINQYAQFLLTTGQFEPALAETERAQKIDPLAAVNGVIRAYILLVLHRGNDSAAQIESTLAAHPDFWLAHAYAVLIYTSLQRYSQAEQQVRVSFPTHPDAQILLIRGIANPALRTGALQSLETSAALATLRKKSLVYASYLAWLGADDRALDVLERFVVRRDYPHSEQVWGPYFDPIRNDPRFKAVLKKMGLPYTPPNMMAP